MDWSEFFTIVVQVAIGSVLGLAILIALAIVATATVRNMRRN